MIWILILIMATPKSITSQQVQFDSKELCLKAKEHYMSFDQKYVDAECFQVKE